LFPALEKCTVKFIGEEFVTEPQQQQHNRQIVPLSVVIPTLNEAERIRESVTALAWANEVIVVDGGSSDGTPELARNAGAKVLQVTGVTIAGQRNAGIAAARNRWILALDADEHVPEALRAEIASALAAPKHEVYRVSLHNIYLGRELRYGMWSDDWHVRLFTRERRFTVQRVHEQLEPVSDVGTLYSRLEHTPYRSLAHHIGKIAQYAKWGAEDLHERGRRASFLDVTVVPPWRFVREYILYSGWRDGQRGLVVAALSSCAALFKFAHLFALQWQAESPQAEPRVQAQHSRPAAAVSSRKAETTE
jgi:glycosyltransferase involved in cell wall biosynthesis